MLGYRFQLVSGTFPTSVTRGMNYQANISVSNTGVAPLYNARSVEVEMQYIHKDLIDIKTYTQYNVKIRSF